MMHKSKPLVVIEAPGKIRRLTSLLRASGIGADVWATRGHFCQNPASLWPLCLDAALQETARCFDPIRAEELLGLARNRSVIIATDCDQEGEVIARDVTTVVRDVATNVSRVRLHALDAQGVRAAFADIKPINVAGANSGDARRIIDRLIGSTFSGNGRPVGRVFSAALGALSRTDPVIGHVTLTLPACDGGAHFVARVPVTAKTCALWKTRAQQLKGSEPAAVSCVEIVRGRPWRYADFLAVASGAELTPDQIVGCSP